jgi:hypothetical protein
MGGPNGLLSNLQRNITPGQMEQMRQQMANGGSFPGMGGMPNMANMGEMFSKMMGGGGMGGMQDMIRKMMNQ